MKFTKKIISLVSAGVMAMSCNSVAFADNEAGILSVSNKEILAGKDSAEVIFYFESDFDSSEFVLYQNGSAVGKLVDTGNYTIDGDDIMGDGVYSLRFTVDSETAKPTENEKVVCNTYSVQYGEETISNEVTIDIITPFTDKELEDMSVVDDAIIQFISSDEYISMNTTERIEAATNFLETLESEGLVKSIVLKDNNIFFLYSCGVQGGIMTEPFAEDMNGIDEVEKVTEPALSEPVVTTVPATTEKTVTTSVSKTWESEYYYQLKSASNVIYEDNSIVIYDDGMAHGTSDLREFTMNYVVLRDNETVTAEMLGLSEHYKLEKAKPDNKVEVNEKTMYDDKTEIYTIKVDSMEELNMLYEASEELLEKGIIENAYKQYLYNYGCITPSFFIVKLKNESDISSVAEIEGLGNIEICQDEENPDVYQINYLNFENYVILKNNFEENPNVIDYAEASMGCCVLHTPIMLRTYLIEDESVDYNEMYVCTDTEMGDADKNNKINIRDCSFIASKIAKGYRYELPLSADFNRDGISDVRDASAIAKWLTENR